MGNNPNMRSVPYPEKAPSSSDKNNNNSSSDNNKRGAPNPEKVDNPYGSTAGAGSGEFHVYRHARSREITRLKQLDDDDIERTTQHNYQTKINDWKRIDDNRTNKNRKKRMREKEAKLRKKNLKLGGIIGILKDKEGQEQRDDNDGSGGVNKNKEEFEYTPLYSNHQDKVVVVSINNNDDNLKGNDTSSTHKLNHSSSTNNDEHAKLPLFYANDGSFLENMKKLNKI